MGRTRKPKTRSPQTGCTPGGEFLNITVDTCRRLEQFPKAERAEILYAALYYFVMAKPGDELPTLNTERKTKMLAEVITGKTQTETGVRYGV
jgi:hypothetical protein